MENNRFLLILDRYRSSLHLLQQPALRRRAVGQRARPCKGEIRKIASLRHRVLSQGLR